MNLGVNQAPVSTAAVTHPYAHFHTVSAAISLRLHFFDKIKQQFREYLLEIRQVKALAEFVRIFSDWANIYHRYIKLLHLLKAIGCGGIETDKVFLQKFDILIVTLKAQFA